MFWGVSWGEVPFGLQAAEGLGVGEGTVGGGGLDGGDEGVTDGAGGAATVAWGAGFLASAHAETPTTATIRSVDRATTAVGVRRYSPSATTTPTARGTPTTMATTTRE